MLRKNKGLVFLGLLTTFALMLSACSPSVVEVEKEVIVTQVVSDIVEVEVEVEKEVVVIQKEVQVVEVEKQVVVEVEKITEVEVEKVVEVEVESQETLVIAEALTQMVHLDPHGCNEWNCKTMGHVMHESLVTWNPGDYENPQPQVAKSWTVSEDGRTYTFELFEDKVFYPSGNNLTAHDVKFSLERLKYLLLQKSWMLKPVEKIEVLDLYTLAITIEEPDATFLAKLTAAELGVLDAEVAKSHGATNAVDANETDTAQEWLDQNSIGSGPYYLVRWIPDEEVILERNPDYPGKPGYFKTIVWKSVVDPETQRQMLERGDVDIALNLGADIVAELEGNPDINIITGNMLTTLYMGMSPIEARNPVLSNQKVRQAINYAIDYDGIAQMLGTMGTKIPGIFPIGFLGVDDEMWSRVGERTDIDKANALLEEAGYPGGGFSFELSFRTQSPDAEIVQKIQSDLAEVGIEMVLVPKAVGTFWSDYRGKTAPNVFTMWGPEYVDPDNWSQAFATIGGLAAARLEHEPASSHDLVAQAKMSTDTEERRELYRQIQADIADQSVFVGIVHVMNNFAMRDDIKGFVPNAGWKFNQYDLFRKLSR